MAASNTYLEVVTYLAGDGIGLTVLANLWAGYMPDVETLAVTVIGYQGAPSQPSLGTGTINADYDRFQLRVKGPDFAVAIATIQKCCASLAKVVNQSVGGTYYRAITQLGSIAQDPTNRNDQWVFIVNFECDKNPSASS